MRMTKIQKKYLSMELNEWLQLSQDYLIGSFEDRDLLNDILANQTNRDIFFLCCMAVINKAVAQRCEIDELNFSQIGLEDLL